MKRQIRLTENDLHNIIKESVKRALNELNYKTYARAAQKDRERGLGNERANKFDSWAKHNFEKQYNQPNQNNILYNPENNIGAASLYVNSQDQEKDPRYTSSSSVARFNDGRTKSSLAMQDTYTNNRARYEADGLHHPYALNKRDARNAAKAYDDFNSFYSGESHYIPREDDENGKTKPNTGRWSEPKNKTDWHDIMSYGLPNKSKLPKEKDFNKGLKDIY